MVWRSRAGGRLRSRAEKSRAVFETDFAVFAESMSALSGGARPGSRGFDRTGVNAAVHDAEDLPVLVGNVPFEHDFVGAGAREMSFASLRTQPSRCSFSAFRIIIHSFTSASLRWMCKVAHPPFIVEEFETAAISASPFSATGSHF